MKPEDFGEVCYITFRQGFFKEKDGTETLKDGWKSHCIIKDVICRECSAKDIKELLEALCESDNKE
jgi:hypothetical protein